LREVWAQSAEWLLPFRSIRLCAYTAVGAESGLGGIDVLLRVPVEIAAAAGWLASLVDRTCQMPTMTRKMQTDTIIARPTRIRPSVNG